MAIEFFDILWSLPKIFAYSQKEWIPNLRYIVCIQKNTIGPSHLNFNEARFFKEMFWMNFSQYASRNHS